MVRYGAPGVYVREVAGGTRPISPVGTSTAAFIGTAPSDAALNDATAINNWPHFVRTYAPQGGTSGALARAVAGFFDNGGSRCYVVNVVPDSPLAGGGRRAGLAALDGYAEDISILAAPGRCTPADYEALLAYCEDPQRQSCVAILDPPEGVEEIEQLLTVATAALPPGGRRREPAEGETPAALAGGDPPGGLRPRASDYGALYFPWLVVSDPLTGEQVTCPPSGHLAGVWARTDALRGVHKAPANEAVRGATNLTYRVARQEQELLNPAGVNCIRFFPREGIRVWGARTLAEESSEFRYLSVRRLFIMLRESIARGTNWIVFEPNDERLWNSITCNVSAFLTQVWRDGALIGRTPEEAFFVKCDEETNPEESRNNGEVITIIGVAPVKPAEFVVFEIAQRSPERAGEQAVGGRRV